nr:MAG TPA_asm: hypothetical protein [Caudoviricetes sp.]
MQIYSIFFYIRKLFEIFFWWNNSYLVKFVLQIIL